MEKLLVTSNFSFSHSVFKRLVLQTYKNQGLFGKGFMYTGRFIHISCSSWNVNKMMRFIVERKTTIKNFKTKLQQSVLFTITLTHSHTMTPFDAPRKQVFWKHCGKRRNCSKWAISPFPTVFSTHLEKFLPFSSSLKLSSANSFSLEESKIWCLVMG